MPGLTKVGKTARLPENRVSELSSPTGVPQPFTLVFQQPVSDCHSAEAWVHCELERNGYRLTQSREFFNAPLHIVVQVVAQAANLSPLTAQGATETSDASIQSPDQLAEELYVLGNAYLNGTDTILPNTHEALKCFEQAAALGHAGACSHSGSFYRWGLGDVKQDLEKALRIYLRSVALGTWSDFALIAGIFSERGQRLTAAKYWEQFFDAASNNAGEICESNVRVYGVWYCEAVGAGELEHCVDDSVLVHFSTLMIAAIESAIVDLREDSDKGYAEFKINRLLAARRFMERVKARGTA